MKKYRYISIACGITIISLTVALVFLFNRTKALECKIDNINNQIKRYQLNEKKLNALLNNRNSDIDKLNKQISSKNAEIQTFKESNNSNSGKQTSKTNGTTSETEKPKELTNNERLVNFFASKGITIALNDNSWAFFTSSTPQSYGAPNDWGNNPIICVDKNGLKDNITVWEGVRYIYCPALNKGAKIINDNNYFKVAQIYN